MNRSMLALAVSLVGCANPPSASGDGVCEEALEVVAECTGSAPALPTEGCGGDYRTNAERVVAEGCAALDTSGGKADGGGYWCLPINRWVGLCDESTLEEAAAIATLDGVCRGERTELCDALERERWTEAAQIIRGRVATGDRQEVLSDPAVRWFVRERWLSLVVWNIETDHGRSSATTDYERTANAILGEHFRAYDPARFAMAREERAPERPDSCDEPRAAVVFFPGVVRLLDRREFDAQAEAITGTLPCVVTTRVETGSFVDPSVNAARAATAIAALDETHGELPLHLIGYSQGSRNALQTLLDEPNIAARTRSVFVLNSAARGSEVGGLLYGLLQSIDEEPGCAWAPVEFGPICEWAARSGTRPTEFLLDALAFAMGVPTEDLDRFIDAEEDVASGLTLREFFASHLPGVRSLSLEEAQRFWRDDAVRLPRSTLYMSFRSVVSDRFENLPLSNALFYDLLRSMGDTEPHNDMQVRLVNQQLSGPLHNLEVVLPVAEGNHWQWELGDGAVPEEVMPARMTQRIPELSLYDAYVQTLAEVGLLF